MYFMCLMQNIFADYPKKPVFTLNYGMTYGSEEDDDINEIISDSIKHTINFRIKEEFSKDFYVNFPLHYVYKEFFLDDSYYYIKFDPYMSLNLNSKLNFKFYVSSKWMDYANLDASGFSKDLTNFNIKFLTIYKILDNLKLTSYVKGDYNLFINSERRQQNYSAQIKAESTIESILISGTYTTKFYLPLGDESIKTSDFLNNFVINIEFNPNKK